MSRPLYARPPTKTASPAKTVSKATSVDNKSKNSSKTANNNNNNNADDDDEPTLWGLPRDTVLQPLALLLLSQFILFVGVGAVIPSIPLYGKEIGLSSAANGLVISAPAVALLLLANRAGQFADQARKPAMMMGMALIVVSDLGTACAQSIGTLVVARLGLGAGRGISEAGERGMLADLAGRIPSLRGRALAAQQAVVALGIAIGAPLGGLVIEAYGPRASFLCVSAAALCALVSYIFLPETMSEEYAANSDDADATQQQQSTSSSSTTTTTKEVVAWTTLLQDNPWRGLALCQCGASFGFACKIASIPLLATAVLPGGAIGAGALISAAGLSGLVGAPLGGWITDRAGARVAAVASGTLSGAALMGIPLALSPSLAASYGAPSWLQDVLVHNSGSHNGDTSMAVIHTGIGDMGGPAVAFCALVIAWSTAVSAQGPALTALAQELAPAGSEATSLALPRAAGDGTYIVAPFILGLAADKAVNMPGIECAVAGSAALLGAIALGILGDSSNDKCSSSNIKYE